LLQSKDYGKEEVNLIINYDFDASMSPWPFIKQGKIDCSFKTRLMIFGPEDFSNEKFVIRFNGKSKNNIKGIISQDYAYNLLLEEASRKFVEHFNKEINKLYGLGRPETLKKDVKLNKVRPLKNTVSNKYIQNYSSWIPENSKSIFVYYDNRFGKQNVISYTVEESLDDLISFFNKQLNAKISNWINFVGGVKRYREYGNDLEKNIINIKYQKDDRVGVRFDTEPQELPIKRVEILLWDYSDPIVALNKLRDYKWSQDLSLDEIKINLKNTGNKDILYYIILSKIKTQELIEKAYNNEVISQEDIENIIKQISEIKNYSLYHGAYRFYRGDFYHQLGTALKESEYFKKALNDYKYLKDKYGSKYFGYGAERGILRIKANPIYEDHDYNRTVPPNNAETLLFILTRVGTIFSLISPALM
jgi:hypothetical protein